jgi:hypothetical protein
MQQSERTAVLCWRSDLLHIQFVASSKEHVAQWIANDVAPTIAASGTSLRGIENLDSFDCRPRNGAQVSETWAR